jgi:hypothetical protein
MKKSTWMIRGVVGLLAWIGIGFAVAEAAAVIYPVSTVSTTLPPFQPNTASTVTVSILKGGVDVTATWLPEPGETVQIVVNGLASPTISLVCPESAGSPCPDATATVNPIASVTLKTSAYPGRCTNFDNPSPLTRFSSDFQLSGNNLTSNDCGGMAVIRVTATSPATDLTFILPQDNNFNGIPEIWESIFCPGTPSTCPRGNEDNDASASNLNNGDGIAAFDEYRGFIVSGTHVRTDPRQKDLFVHPVNPQCLATFALNTNPLSSTASFVGGGTTTFATGDTFFGNVNTLSGVQVRRLGYTANATNYTTNEWIDRFAAYSVQAQDTGTALGTVSGFVFRDASSNLTQTPPLDDRQINKNAVYPVAGTTIQKGLRVIECVVNDTSTTMGVATLGSPNGGDNAIIYTQRIVNNYATLGATSGAANLCYQTYQGASLTPTASITHSQLMAKAIEFTAAMEIGHSIVLTPTNTEGATKKIASPYGYHHAPQTGSNLDQAIVNKPAATCGNLFQIPTNYNTDDLMNFKLK